MWGDALSRFPSNFDYMFVQCEFDLHFPFDVPLRVSGRLLLSSSLNKVTPYPYVLLVEARPIPPDFKNLKHLQFHRIVELGPTICLILLSF